MKSHSGRPPEPRRSSGHIIVEWAWHADINLLAGTPLVLGLLLVALALKLTDKSREPPVPDIPFHLITFLAFMVASVGGMLQVWRREAPGPVGGSIHGKIAVALGWAEAGIFWAAALASLVFG